MVEVATTPDKTGLKSGFLVGREGKANGSLEVLVSMAAEVAHQLQKTEFK